MAVAIRRSVWSLPSGDQTLDWYRKAVAQLITRPPSDPSSWRYLAAIHGVPINMSVPSSANGFWDQCQHQSWFFLPWHRGYVASFEAVVAKTIIELGGPDGWALPYWNYSEDLASNPNARLMPPDFFNRLLPNGSLNRCHGTLPLRAFGSAANRDALCWITQGGRCVASCIPVMDPSRSSRRARLWNDDRFVRDSSGRAARHTSQFRVSAIVLVLLGLLSVGT